jgi:hypothetical protein
VFNIVIPDLLGLILIGIGVLAYIAFTFLAHRGLKPTLRPLRGYDMLPKQVGQAIESGGRVHVSLGANSLIGEKAGVTLAGLSVLDIASHASAISDLSPVATTADASTLLVAGDFVRRAYRQKGTLERYESTAARLVALDPVALAGGATSVVADDDVRANILIGSFGPEVALIAEAGERHGISQTIGSDRLEAQAVGYVMADQALIGEEMFVARAYLTEDSAAIGSLIALDILRWIIAGIIAVGAVLQTFGLLH